MKTGSSIVAIKVLIFCTLFCLLSAIAMPKYFDLNKRNHASICTANQIIVETALTLCYADSLAKGVDRFPQQLTESMFDDGKIPTCPLDGEPIQFDPQTGKAFCPHHIHSHSRMAE